MLLENCMSKGTDYTMYMHDAVCVGLVRHQAKISKQSAGHFVIRSSEQAYAAISLIRPDGSMYNQHIEAAPGGIRLKKSTRVFADLAAFVAHYTQQSQSDLPCQLVV
eukprot:m.99824 g.99824  ORF g.99824 m.99824 type:complete len:107 (+) comp10319_c2_seq2:111-431(+)